GPGAADLAGCSVALVFTEQGAEVRRVFGMIRRAVDMLWTASKHGTLRIEVVPRAHRLTLVRTQDVYVGLSVPDIVKKKLDLAGLSQASAFHLLHGTE